MLQYYQLNSIEDINEYRQLLIEVGCNSPYYSYELLTSTEDEFQKLNFFAYRLPNGRLLAVMPFLLRQILLKNENTGLFDVSSPWGYNGPFFNNSAKKEEVIEFWKSVDDWYRSNNVVTEFLRLNFYGNHKNYSGTTVHTLFNVKGDITDWEKFWGNLKSNTRNQFRKAEKSGLNFEMYYKNIPLEKIKDFYAVYIGTMDRRDAIDSFYHQIDYFIKACENNSEKCAIGLVYLEENPISCEFFLISDDTMNSFLGGTDSKHFKLRPNEYLKINAVKWAGKFGLSYYMIGGGLSNGKEDKLYLYKKKYFPYDDDINFYTGRKVLLPKEYQHLVEATGFRLKDSAMEIQDGFFPKYRETTM